MLSDYPDKTCPRVLMACTNRDYDDWESALHQARQLCSDNPRVEDAVVLFAARAPLQAPALARFMGRHAQALRAGGRIPLCGDVTCAPQRSARWAIYRDRR